jgi:hypothetical protein
MSYDPSRRALPPRQGGWPQATPPRAWPGYRDDGACQDADRADAQDEATGEASYWADASSQPQAAYQGQPAYQRELAYQGQPAYQRELAYQGQTAYRAQPGYQAQPAYEPEPTYQGQPGYEDQPGYEGQPAYGALPDYRAEPGYLDAFDGSGDHEYRDYGPTRVIDPLPAAPDGYAYGRGGRAGRSGATGYYGEPADAFDGGDNGYGLATDGLRGAGDGYGTSDAYADYGNGNGQSGQGYQGASRVGYGLETDGAAADDYRDRDYYAEPRPSGPMLMAPDAGVLPHHWQADRDRRQERRQRGVMVGAVTGFLAAAVMIGVTTLAAAIVRPPVSPVVAVGNVFIDRTPTALKNLVMAHFGSHGRAALLLGMYVVIAALAMALGVLTRRAPALGVASVGAGVVVAAFVTITRPQSGAGEVIPWVIGGIAGVAALLWLVRSSAPTTPATPVRPARGTSRDGNRRRA